MALTMAIPRKRGLTMEQPKPSRGGKREGAGRPKGTTKEKTVCYHRRIKPEFVELMDKYLNELKNKKTD